MDPTYYFFIAIGVMIVLLAGIMRLRSRVRRMEEHLFTFTPSCREHEEVKG